MRRQHWLGAAGISLCAGVLAQSANAQAPNFPATRPDVVALVAGVGEADLDSGGTFSLVRWFVEPGVQRVLSPRLSFGASVGFGQTRYMIDDSVLSEDIDIDEASLFFSFRAPVGQRASLFLVPSLRYSGESGVSLDEGSTYGALGGVAWRLSPNFTIGPGAGVFTSLEGDAEVFPFLIIDWAITDRLSLATGRGTAASRGPDLTLSYQATEAWNIGLAGRIERNEFRLDDTRDGVAADGIGIDSGNVVVAQAIWSPSPQIEITASAGAIFGGELEFEDKDGDQVAKTDYDTAPLAALSVRWAF